MDYREQESQRTPGQLVFLSSTICEAAFTPNQVLWWFAAQLIGDAGVAHLFDEILIKIPTHRAIQRQATTGGSASLYSLMAAVQWKAITLHSKDVLLSRG